MSGPLLVPVGDPAGVGPELAIRAALEVIDRSEVILFGDAERLARQIGRAVDGLSIVDCGRVSDATIAARAPTVEGGTAQLVALDRAIDHALAGKGRAIVTGPTSKAAVERAGHAFRGQTEHLARRAGLEDDAVTMMFLGPRLRVALATTHRSVLEAARDLRASDVERAGVHLADALARMPGAVSRPRIVVTGINPHAGETGLFGDEEIRVIEPAVARLRARLSSQVDVLGPIGAETAFRRAASRDVEGVVAMLHDQATIASKLLDFGDAVNVTWGLPFLRTSVDHGVAYDAAAAGNASVDGMRAAMNLALLLTEAGTEDRG